MNGPFPRRSREGPRRAQGGGFAPQFSPTISESMLEARRAQGRGVAPLPPQFSPTISESKRWGFRPPPFPVGVALEGGRLDPNHLFAVVSRHLMRIRRSMVVGRVGSPPSLSQLFYVFMFFALLCLRSRGPPGSPQGHREGPRKALGGLPGPPGPPPARVKKPAQGEHRCKSSGAPTWKRPNPTMCPGSRLPS